jgi:hypothetical protein
MNMRTTETVVDITPAPAAATPVEGANSGQSPADGVSVDPDDSGAVEAPTTSEDDATEDPTKPKKQGGFQRRISELVKKNHESVQQNAQLQRQLSAMLEQQQKAALEGSVNIPPPRLEDYTTPDEYYAAIESWKSDSITAQQKTLEENAKKTRETQENLKAQQDYQVKVAQATEKYPDFVTLITNPELPSLPEISPAGFQAVVDSDNFADVAVFLAKNPVELYNLGSLTPIQAIKEVARIEMRLAAKPVSQKPTTITPPSEVGGAAASIKSTSDMSTDEWMKHRNSELQNKQQR